MVNEMSWAMTFHMPFGNLAVDCLRIAKRHDASPLFGLKLFFHLNAAVRHDGLQTYFPGVSILAFEDKPIGCFLKSCENLNVQILRLCDNSAAIDSWPSLYAD
jgi:hypothetical protein